MARLIRFWTVAALSSILIGAICHDVTANSIEDEGVDQPNADTDASTETMDKRENRGILLRSWRNMLNNDKDQAYLVGRVNSLVLQSPSKTQSSPPILSSLPIEMKIALLQRLTGHKKRAPNSRTFLGVRGKKSDAAFVGDLDSSDEEEEDELDDQLEIRMKKPYGAYRFLGMRGKKDVASTGFYGGGQRLKKPSFNQFMGMRGKKHDVILFGRAAGQPKRASNLFHSFLGMRGKKNDQSPEFDDELNTAETDRGEAGLMGNHPQSQLADDARLDD